LLLSDVEKLLYVAGLTPWASPNGTAASMPSLHAGAIRTPFYLPDTVSGERGLDQVKT
jgi:hypothetical protein